MTAPAWRDGFEAWARPLAAKGDVPGMGVAVAREGRLLSMHGLGARDRESGAPITLDTVFGIGSVTKSFTAVALLQLQERGLLRLEDPVGRHLPGLRLPALDDIRISHLLTHSAGLPPLDTIMPSMLTSLRQDPGVAADMGLPEERTRDMAPLETPEALIAYLSGLDMRPIGAPGEVFSYSNDSYALAGAIIERVAGEAYEDYLLRHVLGPAGMTRSAIDLDRLGAGDDVATLYARRGRGPDAKGEVVRSPLWWQSRAMAPAGFLRSTLGDLLRYLEIFRTGGRVGEARILSRESTEAMMGRYLPCEPGSWYGYGLVTTPGHAGVTLVGHGGAIKGVAAEILLVPERGLTAVGLANLAGAPTGRVVLGILNASLGLDPDTPKVELATLDGVDADIAGTYGSDEGATVEVQADGARVTVVSAGERHEARRVGEGVYAIRREGGESLLRFLRVAGEPAVQAGYRVLRRTEG